MQPVLRGTGKAHEHRAAGSGGHPMLRRLPQISAPKASAKMSPASSGMISMGTVSGIAKISLSQWAR